MPAGLALEIQVTNIDLAGEFEPWRGPQFDRIRIMRDIYAPRFELTFRLDRRHRARSSRKAAVCWWISSISAAPR